MSTSTSCLLVLFLLYTNAAALMFGCSGNKTVTLSPSDPCLYATNSISLHCSSDLDPEQLQFFVGNEKTPYPKDLVQILDNRTASITIENADMSLNLLNILCQNSQTGCFCSQMLRVFELPENVVNVTCIVEDWTSSMTCSWHLRKNYHVAPNITLRWRISGYKFAWMPCPNYVNNSCVWRSTADGDFSMKSIDIVVTAGPGVNRKCLDKSTTTYFKINTQTVAPSAAPSMTAGGYMWNPSDCKQRHGYRTVYMYWKPLDGKYKNGPLIGYDVTIQSTEWDMTQTDHGSRDVTYDSQLLRCDTGYNVTVQARNINGTSPSSSMTISPLSKDISPPNVIVEMSNDTNDEGQRTVDVTWSNITGQHEVVGFTVYTCRNDGGKCDSHSILSWQSVSKDTSSLTFNLKWPGLYLYGVSMETTEGSSGFSGQDCVFTKHAAPTGAPEHVEVHAEKGNSNLLVNWDKLTCKPGRPIIMKYIVRYCVTDVAVARCKDNEVSGERSSVVLQGLEEEQLYNVQVQAVAKFGLLGDWSDIVQKKTNKEASKGVNMREWVNPLLQEYSVSDASGWRIAVGIVSFLMLLIVVFLARFLCWRMKRKLIESGQVDMPGTFTMPLENLIQTPPPPMRVPSDESGYEDRSFDEDEAEGDEHSAHNTSDKTHGLNQNSGKILTPDGYLKETSGQYFKMTQMVANTSNPTTSESFSNYAVITANKNGFKESVACKTSFQNPESSSRLTHKDVHLKAGAYNDGFVSDSFDHNRYSSSVMNKDKVNVWLSSSDIPKSIDSSLASNPDTHTAQKDYGDHMNDSSGSEIATISDGDYVLQSIQSNATETDNVNNSAGVQSTPENMNHAFHNIEPEKHVNPNSRALDVDEDMIGKKYKPKVFTENYVSTNFMENAYHDQEPELGTNIKETKPIAYKKETEPMTYKKENDYGDHMNDSSGSEIATISDGDYVLQSILSNATETDNVNNSVGEQSTPENINMNHKMEPEKQVNGNSIEWDVDEVMNGRKYNSKDFADNYVSTDFIESANHDQEPVLVTNIKETKPIAYNKETEPMTYKNETMSFKKEIDPMCHKKEMDPMCHKKEIDPMCHENEMDPMQTLSESGRNNLSEQDDDGTSGDVVTAQAQPMDLSPSGQCYVSPNQIMNTSSSSVRNNSVITITNNFVSDTKTDDIVLTMPVQKPDNVSQQLMETVDLAAPKTNNDPGKATDSYCVSETHLNNESCSLHERELIGSVGDIAAQGDMAAQGVSVVSVEGYATSSGANGDYVSVDFARGLTLSM